MLNRNVTFCRRLHLFRGFCPGIKATLASLAWRLFSPTQVGYYLTYFSVWCACPGADPGPDPGPPGLTFTHWAEKTGFWFCLQMKLCVISSWKISSCLHTDTVSGCYFISIQQLQNSEKLFFDGWKVCSVWSVPCSEDTLNGRGNTASDVFKWEVLSDDVFLNVELFNHRREPSSCPLHSCQNSCTLLTL